MSEMDRICQNWIAQAPINRVAIFPKEGFQCGMVRRNEKVRHEESAPASFVLTWFLEGRGVFCTPHGRETIHDGCILLRRPGYHWTLQLENTGNTHRYYLQLPMYLYALLQTAQPGIASMPSVFPMPYKAALHRRFILLTDRMLQLQGSALYRAVPDMVELVHEATAVCADSHRQKLEIGRGMLENPGNHQPLEAVAAACGMDYGTFRKAFQKQYGEAPGQYRIRFRIQSARRLLSEGFSVGDAAQMLGYPDIYTFSHQFRQVTGHSPKHERE